MGVPAFQFAATLALALAVLPQASSAKDLPGSRAAIEELAHGSGADLNGIPPWSGMIAANTGRHGWKVLNFYARRQMGVVRLYARYDHGPYLGDGVEQFADSATCPSLKSIMLESEQLAPPHLHNELVDGRPREILLDGVGYELWGDADGPMARTTINEAEGGPLSAFMARALSGLQSCWTSKPPS